MAASTARFAFALVLALVGVATCSAAVPSKVENRAFENIGGIDYFVGTEITLSWFDAIEFCNALNLSLANMESAAESTTMRRYLVNTAGIGGTEMWLSGHRVNQQQWLWFGSGQLMVETDWATGQPDDNGANVCVTMNGDGGWFDHPCNLQFNFLCE